MAEKVYGKRGRQERAKARLEAELAQLKKYKQDNVLSEKPTPQELQNHWYRESRIADLENQLKRLDYDKNAKLMRANHERNVAERYTGIRAQSISDEILRGVLDSE